MNQMERMALDIFEQGKQDFSPTLTGIDSLTEEVVICLILEGIFWGQCHMAQLCGLNPDSMMDAARFENTVEYNI